MAADFAGLPVGENYFIHRWESQRSARMRAQPEQHWTAAAAAAAPWGAAAHAAALQCSTTWARPHVHCLHRMEAGWCGATRWPTCWRGRTTTAATCCTGRGRPSLLCAPELLHAPCGLLSRAVSTACQAGWQLPSPLCSPARSIKEAIQRDTASGSLQQSAADRLLNTFSTRLVGYT